MLEWVTAGGVGIFLGGFGFLLAGVGVLIWGMRHAKKKE